MNTFNSMVDGATKDEKQMKQVAKKVSATITSNETSTGNTFLNGLENATNFTYTENGALAHKTTKKKLLDLFAFGSAYRSRSDDECVSLFQAAYDEDAELATKCLFYIRDAVEGTGERRFFRLCYKWLATKHPETAKKNLQYITYKGIGRWDDLYCLVSTPIENDMFEHLKNVTNDAIDIINQEASGITVPTDDYNKVLVFKWLKSENTSNPESKALGKKTREAFGMTSRAYRKMLSTGRAYTKVLERLMSDNNWDAIEFDKLPSKAGLKYKHAFATHTETKDRYEAFANDENTTVNAKTLFPYEIVQKVGEFAVSQTDRKMLQKMWTNLPDVFAGKSSNMICVCDTSGSMYGRPMDIAVSLSLYCAERLAGPFHNKFISFSSTPSLIDAARGVDLYAKVHHIIEDTPWGMSTNLTGVFDLLLKIADRKDVKEEDIPDTICVISDMEIDYADDGHWSEDNAETEMERIRHKWNAHGHKMPRLVYWNANARNDIILDSGENVSFVSGASHNTFKAVLTGKNGFDMFLETVENERYKYIHA